MHKPAFTTAGRVVAALTLLMALATPALAENNYRAEIVVLERMAEPVIKEQMADKQPAPTASEADTRLWVVDEAGNVHSDIQTTNNLTLNTAASRLENSGKYRVLLKTGWNQEFPPDYDGEPLRIEIGEYLERAGHRAIEGTIEINRRRYLLVNVQLNQWQPASAGTPEQERDQTAQAPMDSDDGQKAGRVKAGQVKAGQVETERREEPQSEPVNTPAPMDAALEEDGKELITWIRETRRMRSEEIHFLDSPTIGVLVYFRPLD